MANSRRVWNKYPEGGVPGPILRRQHCARVRAWIRSSGSVALVEAISSAWMPGVWRWRTPVWWLHFACHCSFALARLASKRPDEPKAFPYLAASATNGSPLE
jgi:hypothetical protein